MPYEHRLQSEQALLLQYLSEAIEVHHLKLGDTHPHTKESLNNLIELYETWDKPEKAKEWRVKLTQIEDFEE